MDYNVTDEFDLDAFARYYEVLSDTFIDIRKAAASLKKLIPKAAQIFEIGLGTGYFAEQFLKDGYSVCGIQPPDKMLPLLKKKRPNAVIKAEANLENYVFDGHYDVIVSHSSVFLFAQFIAICRRSKWSKYFTNSPLLALVALVGSSAARKINSACPKAFC